MLDWQNHCLAQGWESGIAIARAVSWRQIPRTSEGKLPVQLDETCRRHGRRHRRCERSERVAVCKGAIDRTVACRTTIIVSHSSVAARVAFCGGRRTGTRHHQRCSDDRLQSLQNPPVAKSTSGAHHKQGVPTAGIMIPRFPNNPSWRWSGGQRPQISSGCHLRSRREKRRRFGDVSGSGT
jgi:hypothetical protein